MAKLGNTEENFVMDGIFRRSDLHDTGETGHTSYWLALMTTAGTETVQGTELAYTGYARVELPRNYSTWTSTQGTVGEASTGTTGRIENAIAFVFPKNTGADATFQYWAIMDSATSGTGSIKYSGSFSTLQTVLANTAPAWFTGALTITVD